MQELGTELRGLATAVLSGMTMVCAYVCIRNLRGIPKFQNIGKCGRCGILDLYGMVSV